MDDAAAVKAKKGGRGAFLAHLFLVLSAVATLCAVVFAPRFFFFASGPAPYGYGGGDAIVAAISVSAPSSTTRRTPSPSVPPPLGLEHVVAAGRVVVDADQQERHGGALHRQHQQAVVLDNQVRSPCASMPDHAICCDRSDYHSDVCFVSGDVRTDASSLSLLLFPPPRGGASSSPPAEPAGVAVTEDGEEEERIRPYTRKWDTYITKTIHEVKIRRLARRPPAENAAAGGAHRCDVQHDAPAVVVTAGGYSHNMFHVFNDGFLPLWLTTQHLRRRVVLAVLAYGPRWAAAYGEILAGLSGHDVVDLLGDKRTHCFPGAIVGTRYHDYLAVDPARLRDNRTIVDFHDFLAGVYDGGGGGRTTRERRRRRPRLGIVSRKGRRVIENQAAVARLAAAVGFEVEVMETGTAAPLPAVYAAVSSYDALVGVHGADLTAFLFLRPGGRHGGGGGGGEAALAQVAPLGIAALSRNLFAVPAARMGLVYEQYDVGARESSLSRRYPAGDVVVADPARARREHGKRGREWELVEHVYLRGQNVSLDLGRFRETLARIHSRLMERRQDRHVPSPATSPEI